MMMRRPTLFLHGPIVVAIALCLALSGCSGLVPRTTSSVDIYDFGPVPFRAAQHRNWRLGIDVRMPVWYDALPVDYRLDYDDPLLQRSYANSRWAAAPAVMIGRHLRRQLGLNEAGLAAECLLRVDVDEFAQVFSSPQASRAVLHATVTLVDAKRRPLASESVHLDEPAATPDARGGVHALVMTAGRLGESIDVWLARLEQDGRMQACSSSRG